MYYIIQMNNIIMNKKYIMLIQAYIFISILREIYINVYYISLIRKIR